MTFMQNPNKPVGCDPMAPENEPTDEERHPVMREALELAMERQKIG